MTSLWADGWFYISVLGFCASLTLFFYLLGLYRCAVESCDDSFVLAPSVDAEEPLPSPQAADFLQVTGVTPILAPEPGKKEAVAAASGFSAKDIELQMERFDQEIFALRDMVARQAAQGEIVLKRLMELADSVKAIAAPAPQQPAAWTAPVSAPAPVEPLQTPASTPVETVLAPAPAAAETHIESMTPPVTVPEEEPRRKGPVWPV